MSLHVMIDLQCPNNAGSIAALNHHGKPLTEERCWPWFVANFCKPIYETSFMACWPQTLDDSMATGMKSTLVLMFWYLWSFFSSASVAAEPAFLLLASTYDCAYVLGHVATQARQRPLFHGIWVAPSGLLSLLPQSECGSRVAYVPAALNARHQISLTWLWHECHPEPWRQDSRWWPLTATSVPHTHMCHRTIGAPSRRLIVMRMVALSILSPMLKYYYYYY